MSAESEELLKKVEQVKNITDEDGHVVQPAMRYLTMQERIDREADLKNLEDTLNQPAWVLSRMELTHDRVNSMRQRRQRLKKELQTYSPPTDISGPTKDALYQKEKELAAQIQEGMVPREDMTRNPVGAVDQNIKWQRQKKAAILAWKNIKRILNPDSEEKDLANVEQLRPARFHAGGVPLYYPEAELPSKFSMTAEAKENFDDTFPDSPTIDTPLKQAERREAEELLAKAEAENAALKEQLAKLGRDRDGQIALRKQRREVSKARMEKYWADRKAAKNPQPAP